VLHNAAGHRPRRTEPATAALVLEYIQVGSITAGPSAGPALAHLIAAPGEAVFLQIALRDTLGAGPEFGQPGTVARQTNGGNAGPGLLGLAGFFIRFDGLPGIAVNPAPTNATNARLVDPVNYGTVTNGTNPPTFTRIGGLLNFGSEPGAVPDPVMHCIALFNLRITFTGAGTGYFSFAPSEPGPDVHRQRRAPQHRPRQRSQPRLALVD